jgi:hypothetical protein
MAENGFSQKRLVKVTMMLNKIIEMIYERIHGSQFRGLCKVSHIIDSTG